jgi:hypothetical protein
LSVVVHNEAARTGAIGDRGSHGAKVNGANS